MYLPKKDHHTYSFEHIDIKKVNQDVRIKKLKIKNKILENRLKSKKAIENPQIVNIVTP